MVQPLFSGTTIASRRKLGNLTAEKIEAFAGVYLSPRYDSPQPTPEFHRECWTRYCGPALAAATAAPRNHAKSTGLTHDYGLANVVFREASYVIVVGASEEMAIEHLGDMANELRDNDELIRDFKIKGFVTDQKTDIIVECTDGYQFRIIARGAEQKIRGRKWNGKRPGLIIGDDLEDDEQVENKDRRKKFRRWFFRACKQSLRDGGKIRVHGTILHEDSLLNHLMKNKAWSSKKYKAHKSFSDFTDILWEEKFSEERLRLIRQEFINEGDSAGYSQEYLNEPGDNEDVYLKKEKFLPMQDEDHERFKLFTVGWDFALSKADAANRTSATVGGQDTGGILHIVDERVGRWDIVEIVNLMFEVEKKWHPDMHVVEGGVIWKGVEAILNKEMPRKNTFLNILVLNPVKDKKGRGRSFQKRHNSGNMRYDKNAEWYAEYEDEQLKFTGDSDALLDDQFDSTATLCMGLEKAPDTDEEDEWTQEEVEELAQSNALRSQGTSGRNKSTGY